MHSKIVPLILLSLGLLPLACAGDDTSSGSESESGAAPTNSTDSGTDSSTSSSTNSSTSGTASESGTDGTATDGTATTAETTSETSETGGGEIADLCLSACEKSGECEDELGSVDECVEGCVEGFSLPGGPECDAGVAEHLECMAAASCEELEADDVCLESLVVLLELCDSVQCDGSFTEGAVECGFLQMCSDDTIKELTCDADGCVCLENGVEVGSCVNDICAEDMEVFDLVDKAEECCGF